MVVVQPDRATQVTDRDREVRRIENALRAVNRSIGWYELRRRQERSERQRRIVLLVLLALAGVTYGLTLAFGS